MTCGATPSPQRATSTSSAAPPRRRSRGERSHDRFRRRPGATTLGIAAGLIAVLGLAAAIRIVHLNAIGFNSDEAVYAGQAAAIANEPVLAAIFPMFRAHPLLFQFVVGVVFSLAGASDGIARFVAAAVGVATVLVTIGLGRRLYGQAAGLVAGLFLALMPYHVVVSRQMLLDGPMVLCSTMSLYFLARFAVTERPAWLYAAAAGMGLTFLAKETGILLVGAIYAFLALSPKIPLKISQVAASLVAMVAVMSAFPAAIVLAGGGSEGKAMQYLVWQLFRRPNHDWDFYLSVVPPALGPLIIAAAVAGLWLLRRRNGWRERLLIVWILVPIAFFQLWPTKGFQYLLPVAPPLALLAARTLVLWPRRQPFEAGRPPVSFKTLAAVGVIAGTLLVPSWASTRPAGSDVLLAGSGGVPGGRQAGLWVREHVPTGATLMTIGPSMANIIKFYGHHRALGLSVSPNPLHRNPSYDPVLNPDYLIRTGEIQYVVWDSFSAARSRNFSDKLLSYVDKYAGRAVHTQTVSVRTPGGVDVEKPVIIIYEVNP
jgi:hypothetical protein